MKKVFAILLVLAVVAGFVFADGGEKHIINIKSTVGEVKPSFKMSFKTAVTNSNQLAVDVATPAAYGTADSTSNSVDVGFDLSEGGDVSVVASIQKTKVTSGTTTTEKFAKTVGTYYLTFSDGIFGSITANGAAHDDVEPSSITLSSSYTTENAITGITSISLDQTNHKATIHFNGTAMTNVYDLVTAKYTYAPDSTIDPDTYYADVVLTITVGN